MKFLLKNTGSEKGYILLKMQLALMAAVAVSFAYTLLNSGLYLLQVIPAFVLLRSSFELRKKHSEDFQLYFVIFFTLLMLIIATPFLFHSIAFSITSPAQTMGYMMYAVFAVLALLVLARTMQLKKVVRGKVILADQATAVVEIDVDLLAGIRAGKYVVENKGAKKGDTVRVSVQKGLFRRAMPSKVVGKA